MAVWARATPTLTPTRAPTTAAVGTGESRSRRRICFCRQVTRVSAAPNVAPVATAQPSSPGVTNWMAFSDRSSTCRACSWNRGGVPVAARLAWSTRAPSTCCTSPARTGSAAEK